MLLDYHIRRFVLGSLCVGDLVRLGLSAVRVAGFSLQHGQHSNTAVPSWSRSQAVSKPVWRIPLLCVKWKTPDDGQSNCAKHVEFYSKNVEKLVHLVGFIVRIYHDARSPERQIVHPQENFYVQFYGISCGLSCFCLHVLLHHIAALFLYSFSFMFFFWYICFANWALANFTFFKTYILIYLYNKNQKNSHVLN